MHLYQAFKTKIPTARAQFAKELFLFAVSHHSHLSLYVPSVFQCSPFPIVTVQLQYATYSQIETRISNVIRDQ